MGHLGLVVGLRASSTTSSIRCSAVQRSSAKAVRPANSLALAVVFYIEIRGRLDSQLDVVVAGRAGHGHGHVSGPWPWPRPGVALTDLRSLQTQTANFGPQSSGTDRDSPVQPDAPGKRRQPCGMGGIPLRFLSIGCASSRLTRSQGGHEA